jgi:N6-L-threonylcarbamoyladenine synthase
MKILAIETSCDDTGIAILEVKNGKFSVLANVIASQIEAGQKYGGVFPAMAKREHQKNILPTFITALKESGLLKIAKKQKEVDSKTLESILIAREPELLKVLIPFLQKYDLPRSKAGKPDIDLISVTNGPGLEPCLWVGVNFAKAISSAWNIPIVPVNHIESHILVNLLENENIKFPAIALVVSGGHTQIILVKKIGSYKILGETRDDAAGECFDKCAKILGLGYPGGPIIAHLASKADRGPTPIKLPRPMISTKDYDFSFSGLKTAVLYAWQNVQKENSEFFASRQKTTPLVNAFSAEIQQAIIDVLLKKTMKAVFDFKARSLILGGGVSANQELRKQFSAKFENVIFPKPNLSTDNALMTAITGFYTLGRSPKATAYGRGKKNTVAWKKISADGNLRIK